MKEISSCRMRRLERLAFVRYGISPLILMENAARSIAEEITGRYPGRKRILVLCGGGNNGGDGFAAARHLCLKNMEPEVFFAGSPHKLTPESRINYDIVRRLGLLKRRVARADDPALGASLGRSALVLDALLGTGLSGAVREPCLGLIRRINASGLAVVSADVPSGLDSDSGRALPEAVRADLTVALGFVKRGLLKKSARPFVGRIVAAYISLP